MQLLMASLSEKLGHSTWITAANVNNSQTSHTTRSKAVPLFSDANVLDAQLQDPVISRVLNLKRQSKKPPAEQLEMEPPYAQILLSEWNWLHLAKSRVLRHCSIDLDQLV